RRARRRNTDEPAAPGRERRLVPRRGAAPRPRAHPRRRRLPVPAQVDRIPASGAHARRVAHRGRLPESGLRNAHRRLGTDPHRDARVTTVATLRAVTREVETGRDVVDGFEPDGFAWLHDGTRIVATGVVARVAPADIVDALAAIDTHDPLALPGT